MAIRQTYQSHLIGVGGPMTGEKLTGTGAFTDSVRFLPFAQGLAYSFDKNVIRESMLGQNSLKFNRQTNWSDVSVNVRQLDYYVSSTEYNSIFEDVHLVSRGDGITGVDIPMMSGLVNGERSNDGAAIYFLTDTGSLYRDQILNSGDYLRQYRIFDPCYLASISWSQSVGSVALYEFEFAANYIAKAETTTGDLQWESRRPLKSGAAYTGQASMTGAHSTGSYINVQSASGLFQYNSTTVSGAPDFGEINGINWSLPINRSNVYSLGNPTAVDRKITPYSVGEITIEYNYEGQEINHANIQDTTYNIDVSSTNLFGDKIIYKVRDAIVESAGISSSVGGEDDTYQLKMSFQANPTGGFFFELM